MRLKLWVLSLEIIKQKTWQHRASHVTHGAGELYLGHSFKYGRFAESNWQ